MAPLISASSPNPSQNVALTAESTPQINGSSGVSDGVGVGARPAKANADSVSQTKPAFASVLRDRLKATVLNKTARDGRSVSAVGTSLPAAEKIDSVRRDSKKDSDTSTDNLLAMLTQDSGQKSLASSSESTAADALANQASLPQGDAVPTLMGDAETASPLPLLALPTPQAVQSVQESSSATPAITDQAKSPLKSEIGFVSTPQQPLPSQPTTAEAKATATIAAASDPTDKILPDKPLQPTADGASFPDLLRATQSHSGHIAAQAIQPHGIANEPTTRAVQTPMNSARWADDVGNQLTWMVGQRESKADLVLNPPQLGRIEVSISITGDQATASFVSANSDVRDALQGSLPRLREILADTGVFLGQASVGAESSRHGNGNSEKGRKSADDSFSAQGSSLLGSLNAPSSTSWVGQGKGLVDLFA